MSPSEFKREFLLEYDSHASNRAPGMNDYMISYWLTASQNELTADFLTPKSNLRGEGFEMSETRRRKLSFLVATANLAIGTALSHDADYNIHPESKIFDVTAERVMEIKQEALETDVELCGLTQIKVVPVTHDEYNEQIRNPFRTPDRSLAWRIDVGNKTPVPTPGAVTKHIEILSAVPFNSYKFRYVVRPFPIITADLTGGLTIDGESKQRTSQLDESMHPDIISRAVTRALETVSNPRFQSHAALDQMQVE